MKTITWKVIENARPGKDLIITDNSDTGVTEFEWRDHSPMDLSVTRYPEDSNNHD